MEIETFRQGIDSKGKSYYGFPLFLKIIKRNGSS